MYSTCPDDIQQEEQERDSDPDAPVLVDAPSEAEADAEVGSPSSSVGSTAAAVSEGEELEVVFEEGDLGITIKVRAYHFIAFARLCHHNLGSA